MLLIGGWRRAWISLVVIGLPLALMPPWRHLDVVDQAFYQFEFGEFDRHALFWRPPFSREVSLDSTLTLPVEFDGPRFARELAVGALTTYLLLTIVQVAPRRRVEGVRALRPRFGVMAPLVGLLLPIPPVGLLAFSSWTDWTDSNHGISFFWPMLSYWATLSMVSYVALNLSWYLWHQWRASRGAS